VDDQDLADVLDRIGAGAPADLLQQDHALPAVVAEDPDLDQLVTLEAALDFRQYAVGETRAADHDDGAQCMGARPERAALGW
jgi:hypothetical protein